VTGQNGSGQNGIDKLICKKWYWTNWYGQNGIWTKLYKQNGNNFYLN